MIRLNPVPVPIELDEQTVNELTELFKETGQSVWNRDYIKIPLLESSHKKCAYCETYIFEESKYMEVEHFYCKRDFPDFVLRWDNLLPSCKRCNGRKSSHNVELDGPLVNPYKMTPAEHLYLSNYRLKWKDDVGLNTIVTLHLNDSDRLLGTRMQVGTKMMGAIEQLYLLMEEYRAGAQSALLRNRIFLGVEELLKQAQPETQYSAVAATVLANDENYKRIAEWLKVEGVWDRFEELDVAMQRIVLNLGVGD